MKDVGKIGAMNVPEAESRQEGAEDRTNEDWRGWLGKTPPSTWRTPTVLGKRIDLRDPAIVGPLTELGSGRW